MITKEEIVEILCNHGGYMDRSRTEQGIHEDNFQDVADAILSKLSQHDVISAVCECTIHDPFYCMPERCSRCNKPYESDKQTDL